MVHIKLKLKDKIRNKLKDWLGVTELDKTSAIAFKITRENNKKTNDRIDDAFSSIVATKNKVRHNKESIDVLHKTIQSVVHIGTDVDVGQYQSGSWAVICVEGNVNLVKFVDLNGRDMREISGFLKQFEAGRHCIDTPHRILYDEMFKF